MSGIKKCKWTLDNLEKEVKEGRLSIRAAASKYGVPRSTVHDHLTYHEPGVKPGPAPILKKKRG